MMKNAFHFTLKTLVVFEVFKLTSEQFWSRRKRLGKKAKVNFKMYDVINWKTNNNNTHIAQYLKK